MTLDELERLSPDEINAHAEAAVLGQMRIMQAAIEALITVSLHPEQVQFKIAQAMDELESATSPDPRLAWVPKAIAKGASVLAKRFDTACQVNTDRPSPKAH